MARSTLQAVDGELCPNLYGNRFSKWHIWITISVWITYVNFIDNKPSSSFLLWRIWNFTIGFYYEHRLNVPSVLALAQVWLLYLWPLSHKLACVSCRPGL